MPGDPDSRRDSDDGVALARRLQAEHDAELRRIAAELHDELAGGLTAIALDLGWFMSRLDDAELRQRVRGLSAQIEESLARIRRLSGELWPSVVEDLGLVAAVEGHVAVFQRRSGRRVHLSQPEVEPPLDAARSITAFRVLGLALDEIQARGGSGEVVVSIGVERQTLVIDVSSSAGALADGGVQRAAASVRAMRDRAAVVGGEVEVGPDVLAGLHLTVRIPLATDGAG